MALYALPPLIDALKFDRRLSTSRLSPIMAARSFTMHMLVQTMEDNRLLWFIYYFKKAANMPQRELPMPDIGRRTNGTATASLADVISTVTEELHMALKIFRCAG